MAKKRDESSFMDRFGGVIDFLKGTLFSNIRSSIKENFEQAMDRIEERLLITQKHMMQSLAIGVLLFFALLSLVVSGLFYLRDAVGVSRSALFLYLAIVLGLLAFVIHYTMRRETR